MSRFAVVVDNERRIVKVTHVGQLDVSTAKELVRKARTIAHRLGYNLLYDFRESFLKASVTEMYLFPREHELLAVPEASRIKSANIIPLKDNKADWLFYEVTAQNAGLNWRAFKKEKDALKWLEGGQVNMEKLKDRRGEFKKLTDEVLKSISKSTKKGEICISTENVLHMLINLNQQIDEQRENIDKLSKQQKELDGKLNILIKELVTLGYIKVGEKRKLFKRNILNQDALINLLVKKKLISKSELLNKIRLLKASQSTP